MKVLSRTSIQLALTLILPLVVGSVGYLLVGSLAPSVIVAAAVVATLAHIAVTVVVDLQTVVEVEYEAYKKVARSRQELLLREEEQANRFQLAATIHDTVINTLCAVTLSSLGKKTTRTDTNEQLKQRCLADLKLLRSFTEPGESSLRTEPETGTWTDALLEEAASHATRNDLELILEARAVIQMPSEGGQVIILAIREALTNVAKHSARKTVRIVVDQDEKGPVIRILSPLDSHTHSSWTSTVDDFSLFSLGSDVEVSVVCTLFGELLVTVRPCPNKDRVLEPIEVVIQDHVAIPLMRTINFWLTGLNIIIMMMFFSIFPWWQWLFAALLAVSVSMSLTNLASLGRPVSPRLSLLVALSSAVLVASPIFVAQLTVVDPTSQWWILLANSLIVVAAAWTSPNIRWAWVTFFAGFLAAISLAMYQWISVPAMSRGLLVGLVGVALVGGLIIVVVSSKARAMTDAAGQRIGDELRLATEQADAASVAKLRTEIRGELIGRCMKAAEPILVGISTGGIDAYDPQDRQAIWLLERQLRSAISLGRELDPLSGLLFESLWQAHDRGIELKVNSYRGGAMNAEIDVGPLGVGLQNLIYTYPAGTVLGVSTYEMSDGRRLLVVAQQPGKVDQEIHEYELIP